MKQIWGYVTTVHVRDARPRRSSVLAKYFGGGAPTQENGSSGNRLEEAVASQISSVASTPHRNGRCSVNLYDDILGQFAYTPLLGVRSPFGEL